MGKDASYVVDNAMTRSSFDMLFALVLDVRINEQCFRFGNIRSCDFTSQLIKMCLRNTAIECSYFFMYNVILWASRGFFF